MKVRHIDKTEYYNFYFYCKDKFNQTAPQVTKFKECLLIESE